MNLKKNYNEIINENSTYTFNKDLLQLLKKNDDLLKKDDDLLIDDLLKKDDDLLNDNFINYIFYGPPCSYKYKNALKLLQHFSPSNLKYEKKLHINLTKSEFYIKISDIHYEIDVENFIYNSKSVWNEIYNIIYNSIASSPIKKGYIVFRNFDKINYDLLDLLYNYMQKELFSTLNIKYIIITECVSFIPIKIINICKIINFAKLSKKNIYCLCNKQNKQFFKKLTVTNNNPLDAESIYNKVNNPNIFTHLDISNNIKYIEQHSAICNTFINLIVSNNYNISNIRTLLYDILINHLNSHECFFYIIQSLIINKLINSNKISDLIFNSIFFLKNYNNNYRPIFHLESFTLYLIELINENK
uniref:Uncharacterized protein n=1 Tax=viral metagenome TaxID=1070528 RepID=A0A6C0KPE9_9ZZZZ